MGGNTNQTSRAMRNRIEYIAVVLVAAVLKVVPRRVALAMGAALGQVGWWTGIRRRKTLENLALALPDASPGELRRVAARAARNFGRTVCEFLRFAGAERERVLELVEVEGLEDLGAALEEGHGAVVVTGHLGAWALYVAALGAAGVPAALLVGVQSNPLVDQLILGIPGDAIQFISKAKTAPREILLALRASKAVVMVADHYSSDQRVYVPFLGKNAYTLPLPGALVAKHGTPLFCMTGHRRADGRHALRIARLEVPELECKETLRVEVATLCNAGLGAAVREHPDQYFWYHDRWKVRRKAAEATS